jgi:glycosyltransferase involved in cell wall biosynthesis
MSTANLRERRRDQGPTDQAAPGVRPARRPRVLLVAEAANPEWVSIALEGWCHAHALSRVADVHLVTHVRNRENILKLGLREGEDFAVVDTTALERPLERVTRLLGAGGGLGWSTLTASMYLWYQAFELQVWRRYRERLRAGAFDLVHRLTPLSPTLPSPLAPRCARAGVPFVLGPLNGGLPWPKGFGSVRLREREFLMYVRGLYRALPGYRSTRERAAALVVGSAATLRQIPPRWREKTVYVPENGFDPARFDAVAAAPEAPPLRVAYVGRLVPYKGSDMLLEAAAPLVRAGKATVDVIGDGPLMPALRALVRRERLDAGVTLAGWVDHRALRDRLVRAHVFGFPSVREFGGAVVLEAMASGLVPLVADYGGPSELISEATGFAVPLGTRAEIVGALRAVLARLAADPGQLRPVAARARARAFARFTWEAKAAQMLEVYRWVLGQRDRPDFGMPLPDPS